MLINDSLYFQFCLLSVFKPFEGVCFEDFDISPREICYEARQSILALTRTNVAMFSLQGAPLLASFFLSTAGF